MYFDTGGPISPTNIIKDKKFIAKFYKSLRQNDDEKKDKYPLVG